MQQRRNYSQTSVEEQETKDEIINEGVLLLVVNFSSANSLQELQQAAHYTVHEHVPLLLGCLTDTLGCCYAGGVLLRLYSSGIHFGSVGPNSQVTNNTLVIMMMRMGS